MYHMQITLLILVEKFAHNNIFFFLHFVIVEMSWLLLPVHKIQTFDFKLLHKKQNDL